MSAPFATSAAGVAAGIGGSLANTALGAGLSFGLNAMSTSKAHDRQKNMMTRGPTYIMEGLRAAGINPILAAGSSGFGGSTAKAPQAGSATVTGGNLAQAALLGKQMALTEASTAKTTAEAGIISAGQPAADWNARFNLTRQGQRVLEMDRVNSAMPQNLGATAARGGYFLWDKAQRDYSADSARWPRQQPGKGRQLDLGWQGWLKNARRQNDWMYNRAQRFKSYFVDEKE